MEKGMSNKNMKNLSAANTESIVFIVENDTTRRMLMMYLAAVRLDARVYARSEDYLAQHNIARTQYLVLDMQLPGMDGAILQRQKVINGDLSEANAENFMLIPIQRRQYYKSLLFSRFASRDAVSDNTGESFRNMGELQ